MMGFGLLLPLVLIAIVVAYAMGWRPSRFNNGPAAVPENRRSALDVLKERYARGEIGQEEYQEIRRNLES